MPKAKPNFQRIAELAGVSASTVDRVLNNRGGVSDARHQKVVAAARQLDIGRVLPQGVRGPLHFDVLRTQDDHGTEYYRRFEHALAHGAKMLKASVELHRSIWPSKDHQDLIRFIGSPRHRRHGLIIITRDADEIREAIEAVNQVMVPIVLANSTMASSSELAYVGIDNEVAGRTAALMLGRSVDGPGRVLLLTGSTAYAAHRQRAGGFCQVLARDFPRLSIDGPHDMGDDPVLAAEIVANSLAQGAGLVGLYNSGSASSGVATALETMPPDTRPFWVTHEATEPHIELMKRGMIHLLIDQDPEAQALAALEYLVSRHGEGEPPVRLQPVFHIITPRTSSSMSVSIEHTAPALRYPRWPAPTMSPDGPDIADA